MNRDQSGLTDMHEHTWIMEDIRSMMENSVANFCFCEIYIQLQNYYYKSN